MEYKIETARLKKTAEKIMNDYAQKGWRLDKLTMGDLATQFIMVFVRESAPPASGA